MSHPHCMTENWIEVIDISTTIFCSLSIDFSVKIRNRCYLIAVLMIQRKSIVHSAQTDGAVHA